MKYRQIDHMWWYLKNSNQNFIHLFFSEKDFVQLNDTLGIIEHIIRILFYFKSHI